MILLGTPFWKVCTKIRIRDSEQTTPALARHGHDNEWMDIAASNSRLKVMVENLLEQKKYLKVMWRTDTTGTASGAQAEKRGNGETKSGDRGRGGRKLSLIR